jgi:DNA-directed RNA polymerase subunit beta
VGTGLESKIAKDTGAVVLARHDGIVEFVDADLIVIRPLSHSNNAEIKNITVQKLTKFKRSNQGTCFNQKPLVQPLEFVAKDQVIADGPATKNGELALGQNVLVAFMNWEGYNFKDSIIVSERLVQEDIFTSFRLEVNELRERSRLEPIDYMSGYYEDFTRYDEPEPNADSSGVIKVGTMVKTDDSLVWRIFFPPRTITTPEIKLKNTIFGKKFHNNVEDNSLKVPVGQKGVVVDAQIFCRPKDIQTYDSSDDALNGIRSFKASEITLLKEEHENNLQTVKNDALASLTRIILGQPLKAPITGQNGSSPFLEPLSSVTLEAIKNTPIAAWAEVDFKGNEKGTLKSKVKAIVRDYQIALIKIDVRFQSALKKLQMNFQLPVGLNLIAKVLLANKQKLAVGDILASRHGDLGTVSRILPVEDMPFLEDGTPVDVVLSPLLIAEGLNVGLTLEAHLGFASYAIGQKIGNLIEANDPQSLKAYLKSVLGDQDFEREFANLSDLELMERAARERRGLRFVSPPFDGADESAIFDLFKKANLSPTGQSALFDGRTGEKFDHEVTMGVVHMTKLNPGVDEIFQAHGYFSNSLVSKRPTTSLAKNGAQFFGEEAILALSAYGAAYNLKEFLSSKSDDPIGRLMNILKIYNIKTFQINSLPESVMLPFKILNALGINVECLKDEPQTASEAENYDYYPHFEFVDFQDTLKEYELELERELKSKTD